MAGVRRPVRWPRRTPTHPATIVPLIQMFWASSNLPKARFIAPAIKCIFSKPHLKATTWQKIKLEVQDSR